MLAQWAGKFRRRLMGDVVLAADQILWNFQSSREAARQAKPAKQGMPATPEMELTAEAQGGKSV